MSKNLEFQRYGRNKKTIIDSNYISGGEYRKKFDHITSNPVLNKMIYSKAKEMLFHRSGTLYEDMYWFDADRVQVISKVIASFEEEQILYSDKINHAIECRKNIIAVHTHPCSMPPSIADFNSVNDHNYMLGIVLCHDGKIFCYESHEYISKVMYELYVADYYMQLKDEYTAQIMALNELSDNYDIKFWEVI